MDVFRKVITRYEIDSNEITRVEVSLIEGGFEFRPDGLVYQKRILHTPTGLDVGTLESYPALWKDPDSRALYFLCVANLDDSPLQRFLDGYEPLAPTSGTLQTQSSAQP